MVFHCILKSTYGFLTIFILLYGEFVHSGIGMCSLATYRLHNEIIIGKRAKLFLFAKLQPSIDDHVTRVRPSIIIGKEHQVYHLALSPPCEVQCI